MKHRYPIIVSDFDGTLRRDDGCVSENNARAIREYIASGGIFAVCTGRMMSSILPHARKLGLDSLLIAYQGALVLDLKSGETLRNLRHTAEEAAEICRGMEALNLHIHVYDCDRFFVNRKDRLLSEYERVCNVKGVYVGGSMAEYVLKHEICPQKVLAMVDPSQKAELLRLLTERFGRKYYVTTSAGALVEITKKGCDKGDAVRFLADYYKIPIEKTIAVGDNVNDIPMIRTAGLGIAVSNADESLKAAAKEVTVSNNDDAIAHIISKYAVKENT